MPYGDVWILFWTIIALVGYIGCGNVLVVLLTLGRISPKTATVGIYDLRLLRQSLRRARPKGSPPSLPTAGNGENKLIL